MGSGAAGQDAPSTAPSRRFCLSPESLGRVVGEVMPTRVDGASCPVCSRDPLFLRKSSEVQKQDIAVQLKMPIGYSHIKQENIAPLLSPDEFVGLEGIAHLCTGGEAPWLKAQETVFRDFTHLKSAGSDGRNEIYTRVERCRRRMSQLWHVPQDRIAFMPSASEGMNWLARGLDWKEGENVVTASIEFPSVAYAWRNLQSRGVEVRLVPHRNWRVCETDLLAAVDARTRVLAVSHVSFYTGQCLNLAQLADGIQRQDVLFAVDATHSSGVIDVPAELTDLTVSSSYKWMLATHGVAPCYLSARAEQRLGTTSFGWRNLADWSTASAERNLEVSEEPMPTRLEPGNPAMLVVLHLDKSLEILLSIGIEKISEHARLLSEQVRTGLQQLGFTVITPTAYGDRSGNTCFLAEDAEQVNARLAERGVLCWGDSGRVRISTHLYNGTADVIRLLYALSGLMKGYNFTESTKGLGCPTHRAGIKRTNSD